MKFQLYIAGLFALFELIAFASTKPYEIALTELKPEDSADYRFDPDKDQNRFELFIEDASILDSSILFIILEAPSSDFRLVFHGDPLTSSPASKPIMQLNTVTGNIILAMNSNFFSGKFDNFRTTGTLRISVMSSTNQPLETRFKLRFKVSKTLDLPVGLSYTTYLDSTLSRLPFDFIYNGQSIKDIKKIRFQLTVINKKPFHVLSADVSYKNSHYQLNPLFGHVVGGILTNPQHALCKDESCTYTLNIKAIGIKSLNIECAISESVEKISLLHYEEYYDRVYDERNPILYELPHEKIAEGLDITFTLVPVSGVTGLYVNAITLPSTLQQYDWQEVGALTKRITIRSSELKKMRAESPALFVAISATQPGEYMLKVDAHEHNFKGRLTSGVVEAGYLEPNSLVNYIYYFNAFETQEMSFELLMNIISGDANIYIKRCPRGVNCNISESEISNNSRIIRGQSELSTKRISHTFKCKASKKSTPSRCIFAIGLKAQGTQKAYFHLSMSEGDFHRLILPGHETRLNLKSDQKLYLKFSNAPQRDANAKLFVQINPHYGSFNVHISKTNQNPSTKTSIYTQNIISSKNSLYNSMQTIEITAQKTEDNSLFGVYYVAIESLTSCSLSFKFYTKYNGEVTIHSLPSGSDVRGKLQSLKEIAYYTTRISNDGSGKSKKVTFSLKPLKGSFIMFLSTDSSLPTKQIHERISQDHQLIFELPSNSKDSSLELTLGIQATDNKSYSDSDELDFQFYLSFSTFGKAMRLTAGVLNSFISKNDQIFAIEVLSEMKELVIVKGSIDGNSIQMCMQFSSNEVWFEKNKQCKIKIDVKEFGLNLEASEINKNCKAIQGKGKNSTCYILFKLIGVENSNVQVGFTYNDHPFKLGKNKLAIFPALRRSDARINLIYHADPMKPVSLSLDSKGFDQKIYTKLVREDHFDDQLLMSFPTKNTTDTDNQFKRGSISYIVYSEEEISEFGNNPEILISIRGADFETTGSIILPESSFTIQTTMDTKEISKLHVLKDDIRPDRWYYYSFFNSGSENSLRVYICSAVSTKLEAIISKGYQSRPPTTNLPLVSKTSLGSVDLILNSSDLNIESGVGSENKLHGYYTIGVRSTADTSLNIFWNNKEELNYIELTSGVPVTMTIDVEKKLYFSFFARKSDDRPEWKNAKVTFYVKADVKASLYVLKSHSELLAPSGQEHQWRTSLGPKGGITSLKISATDRDFCNNCLYICSIESSENGQVTIVVNYSYNDQPIELIPGFTLPEELMANEKILFRVFNTDSDLLDLTATMLNGYINVYISDSSLISESSFGEKHELGLSMESQKMIVIAPFHYNITKPHDFFILIHNPKLESASFTLAVDKNSIPTPIEPGMTKIMHLAPGESTDYYYTPSASEDSIEVKFEIKQVLSELVRKQAIDVLGDYLEIYHINPNSNDRYRLQYKNKTVHDNKVNIIFDVKSPTHDKFFIHVYNPVGSSIVATVDLMSGGYKMLTYNEFATDRIPPKSQMIYEGYGQESKLLYVDVKSCHGSVGIEFFQGEYDSVVSGKPLEFKEIKNDNSIINYIMLNKTNRAFVRITNKEDEQGVFQIGMFTEKEVQENPYSEMAQGGGGKVEIDAEHHLFKVSSVKLKPVDLENFRHKLTYTLYLAGDLTTMRYAKKCGDFNLHQTLETAFLKTTSISINMNSLKDLESMAKQIALKVENLPANSQLYGVVIATIELFPEDPSYIAPIRTKKVYYDEFIFKTSFITIPIRLVVGFIISVAIFSFLFIVVRLCVFGEIDHLKYFTKAKNIMKSEEISLHFNIRSILESEYYDSMKRPGTEMSHQETIITLDSQESLTEIRF
jgi:hypothetical protein